MRSIYNLESIYDIDKITKSDLMDRLGKVYIEGTDYSLMIIDIVLYLNLMYKCLEDYNNFNNTAIHTLLENVYPIAILLAKTLNRKDGKVFSIPILEENDF